MSSHEVPLLYSRKPFGVASYENLELSDKGNLVDESIVHHLNIPMKNFRYQKFTLQPGLVVRHVADVKITCQRIHRGKIGESIQFSAKVIRSLYECLGTTSRINFLTSLTSEPSETLGIISVKSRIFWALIPGLGIGPVQCSEPRPVSVSVPFNIQNRDQSRYRFRSMSRTETGLGIGAVQILGLSRFRNM